MTKHTMKKELNAELTNLGLEPNVKQVVEEEGTLRTVIILHKQPSTEEATFWYNRFSNILPVQPMIVWDVIG